MNKYARVISAWAAWLGVLVWTGTALAQTTWVVDADGAGSAADCNSSGPAITTVQAAINAAAPGDTVFVCPGIYAEQVVIGKDNLTLLGAGVATVLRPLSVPVISTSLTLGSPMRPIVLVQASGVRIRDLKVDGSLADSGAILLPHCPALGFYMGVYFRGGSGTLSGAHVTGIESASHCGHGVRAEQATVTIANNRLDRYSDNGIGCAGNQATCAITGNLVRGLGPVKNQIQSGIQVRSAASGLIRGNAVTDHFRIGAHGVPDSSVGIFLVYADPTSNPHIVAENTFSNNQVNVQRLGTAAAF